MSGGLEGAGGVGGLLCVTENPASSTQSRYFPSYDANGNISEYVDDSDSVVAHYEYSPFGKITSSGGSKSADFQHCFSTKYFDDEIGLYYYGYRYYSNELGRWINRDPNGELGFEFVKELLAKPPDISRYDLAYAFVMNDSVNSLDYLGLQGTCSYVCTLHPFTGYLCARMLGGKNCSPCFDCPYLFHYAGPVPGPGRIFKELTMPCSPSVM